METEQTWPDVCAMAARWAAADPGRRMKLDPSIYSGTQALHLFAAYNSKGHAHYFSHCEGWPATEADIDAACAAMHQHEEDKAAKDSVKSLFETFRRLPDAERRGLVEKLQEQVEGGSK